MVDITSLTSLSIDSLIKARVIAFNINGQGEPSEPNIVGQVVHTVPVQMEPVSIDPVTGVTNTKIFMSWVPLQGTYKGGSSVEVDQYEL